MGSYHNSVCTCRQGTQYRLKWDWLVFPRIPCCTGSVKSPSTLCCLRSLSCSHTSRKELYQPDLCKCQEHMHYKWHLSCSRCLRSLCHRRTQKLRAIQLPHLCRHSAHTKCRQQCWALLCTCQPHTQNKPRTLLRQLETGKILAHGTPQPRYIQDQSCSGTHRIAGSRMFPWCNYSVESRHLAYPT
jgi:hypothetical protein